MLVNRTIITSARKLSIIWGGRVIGVIRGAFDYEWRSVSDKLSCRAGHVR